jgi:hypothetical protein
MSDRLLAYFDDDDVAHVYDDTYNLTIHHETAEQLEETKRFLLRKGWIPVTERMPKENLEIGGNHYSENVLITIKKKDSRDVVTIGFLIEGGWIHGFDGNVVAWQPMPEPYREGEE